MSAQEILLPRRRRNWGALRPVILTISLTFILLWTVIPVTWILIMSGMAQNLQVRVNFVPLCTSLVLWIIGIFILRLRTRNELKQELAELDALERESKQPS